MSFLPIRVLVIEEHPFKRLVATQVFREVGCEEVAAVTDVAAAVELLERTGPVDIALCNLKDEGAHGLRAIEVLGRGHLAKALIMFSAHGTDLHDAIDRMAGLLGISVLGYVDFPVPASAIAPMLSRYLERIGAPTKQARRSSRSGFLSKACVAGGFSRHEFKAFFQPKFNLSTGQVRGFEVLARWQHPQYGLLYPADFLPLLAQVGALDELFFALLQQGLEFLQQLAEQEQFLSLAFNLESDQLGHGLLLPRLCDSLQSHAIAACRLTFEITECGLLEVSPAVLDTLIRLRMMGAGLSIDDFGTGYSSLERLCQLPFTEIKLDAAFTRDLQSSARNRAVVSSTLALGEALGMRVLVEGVENENQRLGLLKLGCNEAQGYLCARPMNAARALAWLATQLNSRSNI